MRLEERTEKNRQYLAEKRRVDAKRLDSKRLAEENATMKQRIELARGRDTKALDSRTENARRQLHQKRIQNKQRQQQELAEQNATLQKRLCKAKGKDVKNLDDETEKNRQLLAERRQNDTKHRQQELAEENAALKERLENARGKAMDDAYNTSDLPEDPSFFTKLGDNFVNAYSKYSCYNSLTTCGCNGRDDDDDTLFEEDLYLKETE